MAVYENTTPIAAPIAPRSTRDRYPTHYDSFGLGGYQSVQTIAERDAIQSLRRKNGMLVYVIAEDKTYLLKSDVWEETKVKLVIQSQDETVTFNEVQKLKIDTNTGLGLRSDNNEEVTISGQKAFTEVIDSNNNNILSNENQTLLLNETQTIQPIVSENSVEFKTKTFTYNSSNLSVEHVITHNLGTNIIVVNIFMKNDIDDTLAFTVVPYTILDLNTVRIKLSTARGIMVNIIPLEPII